MSSLSAENYFKKGLSAIVEQSFADAALMFRRALELDRQRAKRQPDMRYLSYYGYSLAKGKMSKASTSAAIQACRTAVSRQRQDPVLFLNLGRVYVIAGKVSLAADAFERALALAPDDPTIRAELARVDRRSRPVIRILPRNHSVNVWLGRLRAGRTRRRTGAAALHP
jgi:Flp pilus assembly protein TadD